MANRTLTNFLTYVKYDFKRDDKDTEITVAYNDTIKHLSNLKELAGRKFTSYIALTTGQEDYPLPSTKCHVLHPLRYLESLTSTNGHDLRFWAKEDWSRRWATPNYSSSQSGPPIDYTIFNNSVMVGPLPDADTYILEMDWTKFPTEQSADSDTHELTEEWEEVFKWGTLFRLYAGMGLDEEAGKWKALYQDDELGYPALIRKLEDQEEKMNKVENKDL